MVASFSGMLEDQFFGRFLKEIRVYGLLVFDLDLITKLEKQEMRSLQKPPNANAEFGLSIRNGDKTLVWLARNPLTVSRKSIFETVPVLGSPHPHPNPMKGAIFNFTLFLCVLLGRSSMGGLFHGVAKYWNTAG